MQCLLLPLVIGDLPPTTHSSPFHWGKVQTDTKLSFLLGCNLLFCDTPGSGPALSAQDIPAAVGLARTLPPCSALPAPCRLLPTQFESFPGLTQGPMPFTFPEPAVHTWLPGFSGARMM